MRAATVSLLGLVVVLGGDAFANDPGADANVRHAFAKCRAVEDDHDRLRCYDKLTNLLTPPRWQGRLTAQTENFEISAPTVLRYESDGPIFVMYLKDAQGGIVQNLHIGGGGTSTYLIEKPGTYSLQVSGSETWRIWLDPMS
ncbi:hypothetical protein HCU64_04320 [Methylobacterium sp. C25]|uniref:hypothetical protein n=1 Tax=Methylobacterium sp. C25 TaxID=2721622 RepID=UPI001F4191BC|nr:hypothetical protein [Methylobacterium sp. C25]MCE4222967.1 hypothetical protein [Methylobacterium sp. C25]